MKHVVLIVCDALRPLAVVPEFMPNLSTFADKHHRFTRHRSIFPSDTRANAASLITGTYCDKHGINGNAFRLPLGRDFIYIDTGNARSIDEADRILGGKLLKRISIAKVLGEAGRSLAVISSASPGTTRLLSLGADRYPQHTYLSCHERGLSCDDNAVRSIESALGAPPPEGMPDLDAVEYGISAFLDHIWPIKRPDCTIMWFNEPDVSYHEQGSSSEKTIATLRRLDVELGRIFRWWEDNCSDSNIDIIVASDHGQIDGGAAIDIVGVLAENGFDAGPAGSGKAFEIISSGFVQIYANAKDRLLEIGQFIQRQPWSGLTFSRENPPLPGMFSTDAVRYTNDRTADLVVTFGIEEGSELVRFQPHGSSNLGVHGGLEIEEMSGFLTAAGNSFSGNRWTDLMSSTVDLMPTILDCIGISTPAEYDGRSLCSKAPMGDWKCRRLSEFVAGASYSQTLFIESVGTSVYIDRGEANHE